MKPRIIIIRGPGTNCDAETAHAFDYVGGASETIHINELLSGKKKLENYDIAVFPGGFSYGDDISAGKIFTVKIGKIILDFKKFIASKKPFIGICNGFQILVKSGFLPENPKSRQIATLCSNDSGRFICSTAELNVNKQSPCVFTKNLPDKIVLPIAHGEGKFITKNLKILKSLLKENLNALTYLENPNGSMADIAGLTNKSGNCFGLMPHPERNFLSYQDASKGGEGIREVGYAMFKNAVDYVK